MSQVKPTEKVIFRQPTRTGTVLRRGSVVRLEGSNVVVSLNDGTTKKLPLAQIVKDTQAQAKVSAPATNSLLNQNPNWLP